MLTIKYCVTEYFRKEVLRKRPYVNLSRCIQVIENPLRIEKQEDNRFRFWGKVTDLENKILRVVTLDDKVTIHNAFLDRRFKDED